MSVSSRLSLAPPARSWPYDILEIIFRDLRDSETFYRLYLEDIAQVCRSWRIAALSDRRLWTRILIALDMYNVVTYKGHLRRYLRLSVDAPLSVEIYLPHVSWPTYDKNDLRRIKGLIALPVQEISRWESLGIHFQEVGRARLYGRDDPFTLLKFLRSPMPSLRRLSLCGVRGSFKSFLPEVPLLNALEIKGGDIVDLNLPWSSLTSFRCSYSEHLCQLSQCVRLRDLYIECPQRSPYALGSTFDCTLPTVVSFQLNNLPSTETITLAKFHLPSLQNLTLVVPDSFWDRGKKRFDSPDFLKVEMSTAEHIVSFARTCKVLTLLWSKTATPRRWCSVSARDVTSRAVIFDMFKAMPDLEELCLSDKISQVFLEVIKEEGNLVPKLSRIFILGAKGAMVPLSFGRDTNRW
jgi:hypothetical protein